MDAAERTGGGLVEGWREMNGWRGGEGGGRGGRGGGRMSNGSGEVEGG